MVYLSGFHAIEEKLRAIGSGKKNIYASLLFAKPGPRAREISDLALSCGIPIKRVGKHDLDRICFDHKGIILELDENENENEINSVEDFVAMLEQTDKKNCIVVVLDEITDPHNFGAILRSCDQFGADAVITRNKRTAKHSDTISKASAGASAWVPLFAVASLQRSIELLKEAGFWIYGAEMSGQTIYKQHIAGRICIIMGSEGDGISRLLREQCDVFLSIPSVGKVDSLNVSVAAGIMLYEIFKQQTTKSK
ncbi:MAG: 23S rRNA (guanosine(2251)-2'-O)-methyltransferase RlmB [Termitinemataceae bacterium]|nr:MAG: 23S rRNA (guanosine(2251)-2'-O)-methyltransferase RlmB [Termitinemataceae bacterium]